MSTSAIACYCGKKKLDIEGPISADATFACGARCASRRRGLAAPENVAFKQRLERLQATPYAGHESDWIDLANELFIDFVMVESLVDVVISGKWKNSASPRRYLGVTTRRHFDALYAIPLGINEPFDRHGRRKFDGHSTTFCEIRSYDDGDGHQETVPDAVDRLIELTAADEDPNSRRVDPTIRHNRRGVPEFLRDRQTMTAKELAGIASWRNWNAAFCIKDVERLKHIPELSKLLDKGMLEAALAISLSMTYREFLDEGAWRMFDVSGRETTSTPEDRRGRQAAWRRLSRARNNNPKLRRKLRELARTSRSYRYYEETSEERRKREKSQAEARDKHQLWLADQESTPNNTVWLPIEPRPTVLAGGQVACHGGHFGVTEFGGEPRCRECGQWLRRSSDDYLVIASPATESSD
jgi:hypothetical protein